MTKTIKKGKKKTQCWTRKNRDLINYVVCNGSKGQKGIYVKKTRKLKVVKKIQNQKNKGNYKKKEKKIQNQKK